MAVYNIPIYGLIGSPESPEDKEVYFQYTDLLMHLNKAQMFDTLNLDIKSDGGYCDVADKMIDAIKKTGKPVTTCNSGNVASAASKIFTLAPKGSRFFHPERGMFLIHNPWVSEVEGDAAELAAIAKELQGTENEYAKWYQLATGADIEIIKAFMAENIPLTPEQIESLGFATIIQPSVKAVAKLKSKTMDNKEVIEKMNSFEKALNSFMAFFKKKAMMVADVTGAELEFPDITDASEIVVGVKVNIGGSPATGEFNMPDGSVLKCENGVLTEIVPVADAPDPLQAENDALKAEIEKLKADNATAQAQAVEAQKVATNVQAEFKKFKAQFSKGIVDDKSTPDDEDKPKDRKPFKTKE